MELRADGRRLEARWIGTPAPRALVFLHEGLGSMAQWRDYPDALAARVGLPALVYSRAGYGQSDPVPLPRPLDYMQHEGRAVVPELLDAAGIREPILFGHSDGGTIALVTAATRPVVALILQAAHVFCESLSVESIARAAVEYTEGDLRARLARHHAHVDVAFWGWNRAWLDPGFLRWSIEGELPRVTAPTLVMQAADDAYGTLAQVDAIARQVRGPVERCVFEAGGHALFRARREETLEAATRFLAAHGAAAVTAS